MSTKVYGYSDDNITIQGDLHDEFGCYDTDLGLEFSDGTVLETHYGKTINGTEEGVWTITLKIAGSLFDRIDECFDSDADIYSDIAYFKDGLTSVEVEGT